MQRDRAAGQPSDPDTIARELTASALDLAPPGPDAVTGAGRIRLDLDPPAWVSTTPAPGQPVGDTARFDIAVDDAGTIEASGVSIDGVGGGRGARRCCTCASTRARSPPARTRRCSGRATWRETAPSRPVAFVRDGTRPTLALSSSGNALDVTVTDAESRSGSLDVQIDDVTGALHLRRTLPLTFAAGTATARIAAPAAGARPACGCACRPSTRSGIPPPSPRRGWRPGRGDTAPPRSPRSPPRALAVAARGRARRQLRQRPRGHPLAGGGRRAGDRGGSPPIGARLPLPPGAPRPVAGPAGRGGLRRVPGGARGARVLRARRRPADPRRAARRRGAQRGAPGRLPAARQRLGCARAAAEQAPPVRGGRGRGHRRPAHVRGRQRGRGASRPRPRSPTRRSSSPAIRSRSSGASGGP